MEGYQDSTYGEGIAEVYDEFYPEVSKEMIDVLEELAGSGSAMELGIGTGRVALPLRDRGVAVSGIDASSKMIEKLQTKAAAADVQVLQGDFSQLPVEGRFNLIYVVFNTFFALLTQEEQVTCFQQAADHLEDQGAFLLEVFVPDLGRFDRGQTLRTEHLETGEVRLEASKLDPVNQRVSTQHVQISEERVRVYPLQIRYAWPSELDLMARLAGLQLVSRWGNWEKGAFNADSKVHISVYQRLA